MSSYYDSYSKEPNIVYRIVFEDLLRPEVLQFIEAVLIRGYSLYWSGHVFMGQYSSPIKRDAQKAEVESDLWEHLDAYQDGEDEDAQWFENFLLSGKIAGIACELEQVLDHLADIFDQCHIDEDDDVVITHDDHEIHIIYVEIRHKKRNGH